MICLVHTVILYMIGTLGTVEDGNICNVQRVNGT